MHDGRTLWPKDIVAPQGVSRVLAFPQLVGRSTNRDRSGFAKIDGLSKTTSCIQPRAAVHGSLSLPLPTSLTGSLEARCELLATS